MVLPVGQSSSLQTLLRVIKTENGYEYEDIRPIRFVPLIEGLGKDA